MTEVEFLDEPPQSATVTAYDRAHTKLYLRLLDASSDGADWRDVARALFGLEAAREPERTRLVHDSHLARARWMTTEGYPLLLRASKRH